MINGLKPLDRTLRWGMVGGGGSSQIGYIHRSAALLLRRLSKPVPQRGCPA